MDVVMPKMDGFEARRAIRANPGTNGIPIILVTTRVVWSLDGISKTPSGSPHNRI